MMLTLPDFSRVCVLVVGDIMLDRYVWGKVDRISPEAPIPVVNVQHTTSRLGGAGNVAANLAGIGCKVFLTGILGQDWARDELCNLLFAGRIQNASVCSPRLPTVTKTRIMGGSQQVVRLDEERPDGIDEPLRERVFQELQQRIKQTDVLIISDYGKGLLERRFLQNCITLAKAEGIAVFVDPKVDDWSYYAGANCITPNLKEFNRACHMANISPTPIHSAARKMLDYYCLDHLLVTQGRAGMSLFGRQSPSRTLPSEAREVFDVSGAGDTVIALLCAAFAAGHPMEQAMQLANLGAGEVVGRIGTYALTRADLELAVATPRRDQAAAWDLSSAQALVEQWRMLGQRIVFANGCFDILHPGHVGLLQRAKALGDRLIVGLNTDTSIRRIKGPSRPILPQEDRAAIVLALGCVDAVVFYDEDTPIDLLKALKPHILVKGGDYTPETVVGADLIRTWGGRVELLPLVEEKSTSSIVEKIHNSGLAFLTRVHP